MNLDNTNAFGADFLPGKDRRTVEEEETLRAMERRYGGTPGAPFNNTDTTWSESFKPNSDKE